MLPHFVGQDFAGRASTSCGARGYALRPEWFAPALRVPLPVLRRDRPPGRTARAAPGDRAVARLGEEAGPGGTARYVDSSVERLQVKVTGLTDPRHVRHLQRPPRAAAPDGHGGRSTWPACATARGSRRACLHPTIPVHAPLVFDLVDTWNAPLARRLHVPRGAPRRPAATRRSR